MEWMTDYIQFLSERYPDILKYTVEHLYMSFVSVVLGIVIAIPLGIYLSKSEQKLVNSFVFTIVNIFQTIPTIALLAIMIPFLGIGLKPALVALFLYSLLPLLRNTYTGIKSVDPKIIEAARGMGYSSMQRLIRIELPLAFPYIISGIRVTTVYIISWTTLAAVIGAGGLGGLILSGLGFNSKPLIFTGTIMAIVIAVLADQLIGRAEKRLSYK